MISTEPMIGGEVAGASEPAFTLDAEDGPEELAMLDDRLRLIFTCCHPALSLEAQVALSLRTLGGLGTDEIAAAFLVPVSTMAPRARSRRQRNGEALPRSEARRAHGCGERPPGVIREPERAPIFATSSGGVERAGRAHRPLALVARGPIGAIGIELRFA